MLKSMLNPPNVMFNKLVAEKANQNKCIEITSFDYIHYNITHFII